MNLTVKEPEAQAVAFADLLAKNCSSAQPTLPTPDAVSFLKHFDPHGRHNLVAIHPETREVTGRSFGKGEWARIAEWVQQHSGVENCYFSVNEPKPGAPNKKLSKADIGTIRAISADVDPKPDVDVETARAGLAAETAKLHQGAIPPTFSVDSGGGVQHHWRLKENVDPSQLTTWAESQGRAIAQAVGGDAVQNIDRIMRLPGTDNLPDEGKRKKGRTRRLASILHHRPEATYRPTDLSNAVPPIVSRPANDTSEEVASALADIDMGVVEAHSDFADLPGDLQSKFLAACERLPKLAVLWGGDRQGIIGEDETSSGWRISLARYLGQTGFGALEYAQLAFIWPSIAYAQHKMDQRQLARDWARYGEPERVHLEKILGHYEKISDAPSTAAISWIDPTAWAGKPIKEREWEVDGWIPRHEITLLYGDGGVGKTLLAHQYATAAATGKPWLGQKTRPARVACYFCEDSEDELHRRQADINGLLHVDFPDLANLRLSSRKHEDNALGVWDRVTGATKLTSAWHRLRDDALAWGADVVIIDTLSDVYVGEEIARAQVNSFVKTCLGRLASELGGSIIALGHPSQSGMTSGSGTSGSTQWSNAVRSRLYLRDPDKAKRGRIRELESMKLNYGPAGSMLKIKWDRGAFTVLAGMSTADRPAGFPASAVPDLADAVEAAVAAAINECAGVALSQATTSPNYAPKVLKRRAPDVLQAFSVPEVEAAINRMDRNGTIRHEEIGRDRSRRPIKGYVIVPVKMSESTPEPSTVFD